MIAIFDLDGTVIDSSHRYTSLPGGGIDLPAWIRHNTPKNVERDTLLPLVHKMRTFYEMGDVVIACTARVLSDWDYRYFADNDIPYTDILARPDGLALNDADFKEMHLRLYAQGMGYTWAQFCARSVMWDDAPVIIERMNAIGLACNDARHANARLERLAL